ncbi:hypothetical protein [Flindersiella endophytica]
MRTLPNVPRWVNVLAHLVPLTTLPSGLWRIALGFGVPVGFTGELAELYHAPGWITPYVIVLSLLSEGLALLTLGLVQPWGEVAPRWLPVIGGRRIPPLAAAVPAALGAISVTLVTLQGLPAWWENEPGSPQGIAALVMATCYAPLLAWGPLLAVVTVAYYVRRTEATELLVPEPNVP